MRKHFQRDQGFETRVFQQHGEHLLPGLDSRIRSGFGLADDFQCPLAQSRANHFRRLPVLTARCGGFVEVRRDHAALRAVQIQTHAAPAPFHRVIQPVRKIRRDLARIQHFRVTGKIHECGNRLIVACTNGLHHTEFRVQNAWHTGVLRDFRHV